MQGNNDFERRTIERLTAIESTRGDILRRIEDIEKTHPHTILVKLGEISDEVTSLKRAFYTFGFSVMGGAILFGLTQILT